MRHRKELARYIAGEVGYWGQRGLARRLGVHHSTIQNWMDEQHSSEISEENLKKLAQYRTESIHGTRALFEGVEQKAKRVAEWLTGSARDEQVCFVAAIADRLNRVKLPSTDPVELDRVAADIVNNLSQQAANFCNTMPDDLLIGDKSMCSPVGREIVYELTQAVERGDFENEAQAFDRFLSLCSFAHPEEQIPIVRGLIRGSVLIAGNGEVALIAKALRELSGNSKYTTTYLRRIQAETPAPQWEQGCGEAYDLLSR